MDFSENIKTEIKEYLEEKQNVVSWATESIAKPFEWAFDKFVPGEIQDKMVKTFEKSLNGINSASQFTFTVKSILKPFEEKGINNKSLTDVRNTELEICDAIAKTYIDSNKLISAFEGASLGMGGLLMMAADIPAVMSINFRMISQIANSFGYNSVTEMDKIYMLHIFSLAGAQNSEERKEIFEKLRELSVACADEKNPNTLGKYSLLKVVQEIAEKMGLSLTKRKLGQLIPIIGAGIGAGMNYKFTLENGQAALMAFRQRRLDENRKILLLTDSNK